MQNNIQIFSNETGEHQVRTKIVNGHVLYSLTDMAAPFIKRPDDWLKTQHSKELIKEVSATKKNVTTDLLIVIKGGNLEEQGTWAIDDIALLFAQWLSPKMYLWCNDHTKELLTTGSTSLQPALPKDYISALRALADSEEEKQKAIAASVEHKRAAEDWFGISSETADYGEAATRLLKERSSRKTRWTAIEASVERVALKRGGFKHIREVYNELYALLKQDMGATWAANFEASGNKKQFILTDSAAFDRLAALVLQTESNQLAQRIKNKIFKK